LGAEVLELEGVVAGYPGLTILRGVDLRLRAGTITAVVGANGAGKSTLLKAIFGIVRIQAGRLRLDGREITATGALDRLRTGLAYVPQGRSTFPLMSVEENLEMGAYTRRGPAVKNDIAAVLEKFSVLGTKRSMRAGDLSGGEQQLLEIGMSLMIRPRVVLIDEPSLGLSAAMQGRVFDEIQRLRDSGSTVLLVEQNAVQALRIADSAVILELGRVAMSGSGVEMLDDPDVRRAYLGLGH
jgi:ABC-type branched-subunit amino acid transport system ATPase component